MSGPLLQYDTHHKVQGQCLQHTGMPYLGSYSNTERVVCIQAGCISWEGAAAVLLQQAQAAVDQVAQRVCQVGVHDVPEALFLKIAILQDDIS